MSLFPDLSHLLAAKPVARVGKRFRQALADPFEVLNRYYFQSPWLECKMKIESCD